MMAGPSDATTGATEGDVLRIGAEIRRAVERHHEHGIATIEEIEKVAAARLDVWLRELSIDPKLPALLMGGTNDWNVDVDYEIQSHRTGGLVSFLLLSKKIVRPFVRLYTDHIFKRQAQINLCFFYLAQRAAIEQARLEAEINVLRSRVNLLEDRVGASDEQGRRV